MTDAHATYLRELRALEEMEAAPGWRVLRAYFNEEGAVASARVLSCPTVRLADAAGVMGHAAQLERYQTLAEVLEWPAIRREELRKALGLPEEPEGPVDGDPFAGDESDGAGDDDAADGADGAETGEGEGGVYGR